MQVMVWKTNFDACLASCLEAVAVRAPGTAQPRLGGKHQRSSEAAPSGQGPGLRERTNKPWGAGAAGGRATKEQPAAWGPDADVTEGAIKAVAPGDPSGSALVDGSHAAFDSASFNATDVPGALAGTLQQLVCQLDVLTQTVAVLEERLTISEDRSRRLEQWAAQLQQQEQPQQKHVAQAGKGQQQRQQQLGQLGQAAVGGGDILPPQVQSQPQSPDLVTATVTA